MTLIQTVQLGPRMGRLFGSTVGPSNNDFSQGVTRTKIKIWTRKIKCTAIQRYLIGLIKQDMLILLNQ